MTDLNKWTQKAQEALQNARQLAIRFSHQQLDCEHLLAALLEMPDGLAVVAVDAAGVAIPQPAPARRRSCRASRAFPVIPKRARSMSRRR